MVTADACVIQKKDTVLLYVSLLPFLCRQSLQDLYMQNRSDAYVGRAATKALGDIFEAFVTNLCFPKSLLAMTMLSLFSCVKHEFLEVQINPWMDFSPTIFLPQTNPDMIWFGQH